LSEASTQGWRGLIESIQAVKGRGRELAPMFWACLWLDLFAVAPIFLFIPRYVDDNGRAILGFTDWTWGGRPLADMIMPVLDTGTPLALATPLFQLTAIGALALAGAIVAHSFGVRSRVWAAIGTLPIAAQPYFLENLSYGFDAATMGLALLLTSMAAALVTSRRSATARALGAGLLLVAALALYQPCAAAFLPLVVLSITAASAREADRTVAYVLRVARAVLVFGIALVVYKVWISRLPTGSDYLAVHSSTFPLSPSLPWEVLGNVRAYWRRLFEDWSSTVVGRLAAGVGLASLLVLVMRMRATAGRQMTGILAAATVVLATATLVHGPSLLLTDPHLIQSRTLVAIGLLLSGACLQLHRHAVDLAAGRGARSLLAVGAHALLVWTAWSLIVVSYTYAAAFRSQFEFEQSLITRLAYDVEHSVAVLRERKVETVGFVGRLPTSRILGNSAFKFPYLGRLIPNLISDNWWWGHVVLSNYDTTNLQYRELLVTREQLPQLEAQGLATPLFASKAYRGFIYDGSLVVVFPDSAAPR